MSPENANPPDKAVDEPKPQLSVKGGEVVERRELVLEQSPVELDSDIDEYEDERRDITLANILENPEITKAINTAVDAWAKTQPDAMKLKFWSMYLGIAFSSLVLIVISVLGYLGVLTKEVTGTLIGALIGYWYGRQQAKKE